MDKQPIIDFLNHYLALATIIGGGIVFVFVLFTIYALTTKKESAVLSYISRYALPIGFLTALLGTVLSLYYSDYLGVLPCGLCWFQRVFLYSQVILFGIAWWKKDRGIFVYTFALSLFGLVIALYQHYLQMGYSELLPCPVVASTIDCAKPTVMEFGFVTFPLMSFVLFVLLESLAIIGIRYSKK